MMMMTMYEFSKNILLYILLFVLINKDDLSLRGNIQSPVRPRIESKMGFIPQVLPTVLPLLNLSDNEQPPHNDNSNYDSLVGSLKSDTIYWKDQQATVKDYFYASISFDLYFF